MGGTGGGFTGRKYPSSRRGAPYDRRLASQISHDRCSITPGKKRKGKKIRAPIHFPTVFSYPCLLFVDSLAKLVSNTENLQTMQVLSAVMICGVNRFRFTT